MLLDVLLRVTFITLIAYFCKQNTREKLFLDIEPHRRIPHLRELTTCLTKKKFWYQENLLNKNNRDNLEQIESMRNIQESLNVIPKSNFFPYNNCNILFNYHKAVFFTVRNHCNGFLYLCQQFSLLKDPEIPLTCSPVWRCEF